MRGSSPPALWPRHLAYLSFAVFGLVCLLFALLGVVEVSGLMADGEFQALLMLVSVWSIPAAVTAVLGGVLVTLIVARDRPLLAISALTVLFVIVVVVTIDASWPGAAVLLYTSGILATSACLAGPVWWFRVGRSRSAARSESPAA